MLKIKRRTKRFAFLLVISMIATMFAGLGTASAASTYRVLSDVPAVNDGDGKSLSAITGEIDAAALKAGSVLTIELPRDFEFGAVVGTGTIGAALDTESPTRANAAATEFYVPLNYDGSVNALHKKANTGDATYGINVAASDNTLTISFAGGAPSVENKAYFILYLEDITVPSGHTGDIEAKISSNGGWGSGTVIVGKGSTGEVNVTVSQINSFSELTTATLTFTENMPGALTQNSTIKLRLPAGFSWKNVNPAATFPTWGNIDAQAVIQSDSRYLHVSTVGGLAGVSKERSEFKFDCDIQVDDPSVAKYGDVNVVLTTSGSVKLTNSGSMLVGTYGDFGITVSAESVPEIYAAQIEQKIGNIVIKETTPKSLIANRSILLTLPTNAKWGVVDENVTVSKVQADFDGFVGTDGRTIRYMIRTESGTASGSITLEDMEIMVAPNTSGDVEVSISGSAGVKGSVVVAKAIAPITVTSGATDVKLGVQGQKGSDIVVKEADAGILYGGEDLTITLPSGVKFTSIPTISVTEGDLVVDSANATVDGALLTIPIKTDSATASTITISDVKYTVDRTFPEGMAVAKFGGAAVIAVNIGNAATDRLEKYVQALPDALANPVAAGFIISDPYRVKDTGVFPANDFVVEADVANCITPAPSDQMGTTKFVIGQTTYTYNDSTMTMDVAPYIKDSRTYMPIRFVAYAVGISDANIIWSEQEQTVTLVRDNIVVQVKVGSTELKVNGAIVNMDVAPEILNSRTMLPAAWIAQAFGATVDWDPNTQTVTITK